MLWHSTDFLMPRFCVSWLSFMAGSAQACILVFCLGIGADLSADDGITPGNADRAMRMGIPQSVSETDWADLKTHSPFSRSLDPSESIILTGVARIGGRLFVTLFEKETGMTRVVSSSSNQEGWKLVQLGGNEDQLETVTASVSILGGDAFSVKYSEQQLQPGPGASRGIPGGSNSGEKPPKPERDYREGVSGDGFRGPTPPDLVRKLSLLKEDDRNRIIHEIRVIRDKGVSSEERQIIFRRMVDRAVQQRR